MKSQNLDSRSINQFQNFLILEEYSLLTITQYISDLQKFLSWLPKDKLYDKKRLIEYKSYLLENYAASSVNCKLSALNAYLKFKKHYNLKVKFVKLQNKSFINADKELSKEEYFKLIAKSKETKKERLSMIMQTICSTGIRISELKYITFESLLARRAEINLKGKVRTILIPEKLRHMLKKYCKKRNIKTGPVFITKNNKPVNRSNIWTEMKNLCSLCNINPQKVYPHSLRHLFARIFYKQSKDILKLSDILGHSSIHTTRTYTMTSSLEHEEHLSALGLLHE